MRRVIDRLWAVIYDSDSGAFFGHGKAGRATFFTRKEAVAYERECRRQKGPRGKVVQAVLVEVHTKQTSPAPEARDDT